MPAVRDDIKWPSKTPSSLRTWVANQSCLSPGRFQPYRARQDDTYTCFRKRKKATLSVATSIYHHLQICRNTITMLTPLPRTILRSSVTSCTRSAHVIRMSRVKHYSMAASTLSTLENVKDAFLQSGSRKQRAEGTIASVFASLSGEKAVDLPKRFADLKR